MELLSWTADGMLSASGASGGPLVSCHDAGSLLYTDQGVRSHGGVLFLRSGRPSDFQIRLGLDSQPEMEPGVVRGMETRLAEHRLGLNATAVVRFHGGPDRAPVGLGSNQLDLEPVGSAGKVVPQQRGRLVEIDDENVDIPVIVEVPRKAQPRLDFASPTAGPASVKSCSNLPSPRFLNRTRGVAAG